MRTGAPIYSLPREPPKPRKPLHGRDFCVNVSAEVRDVNAHGRARLINLGRALNNKLAEE